MYFQRIGERLQLTQREATDLEDAKLWTIERMEFADRGSGAGRTKDEDGDWASLVVEATVVLLSGVLLLSRSATSLSLAFLTLVASPEESHIWRSKSLSKFPAGPKSSVVESPPESSMSPSSSRRSVKIETREDQRYGTGEKVGAEEDEGEGGDDDDDDEEEEEEEVEAAAFAAGGGGEEEEEGEEASPSSLSTASAEGIKRDWERWRISPIKAKLELKWKGGWAPSFLDGDDEEDEDDDDDEADDLGDDGDKCRGEDRPSELSDSANEDDDDDPPSGKLTSKLSLSSSAKS
jgi:hypothetical protein